MQSHGTILAHAQTKCTYVTKLAKFAVSQPQASYVYAVYTFGLKHRWTYFLRTLPDIQDLIQPLENAISNIFLPAFTDHECTQLERDILALPVRNGGLGIPNPCHEATKEYAASIQITGPLVRQIESQMHELPDQSDVQALKRKARQEKNEIAKEKADLIINSVSPKSKRMLDLASEKGASGWLQVLPISDMGFNLNKREFKDALKLRYDWPLSDIPSNCVCGVRFNVDHAMICGRGGFNIQRHNQLRDLIVALNNMACCKELCDELSDKTDIFLNLSTASLISFFGQKKSKLTRSGTLNDLKTFVSTIIDEKAAESAVWRSPSGGKWCFTCEDLEITWHSKSGAIIFDGVKAGNLVKRIKDILSKPDDAVKTINSDLNMEANTDRGSSRIIENEVSSHNSTCSVVIEGIKLEMVILETRLLNTIKEN